MKKEILKKQWVIWTILVTSFFSIGTPGIAIICRTRFSNTSKLERKK